MKESHLPDGGQAAMRASSQAPRSSMRRPERSWKTQVAASGMWSKSTVWPNPKVWNSHYYQLHRDINPAGIVPAGPELSGWLSPHSREALGGRLAGAGTPPGPPPTETVPRAHTPLAASTPASS
jgi:hypothetical protein